MCRRIRCCIGPQAPIFTRIYGYNPASVKVLWPVNQFDIVKVYDHVFNFGVNYIILTIHSKIIEVSNMGERRIYELQYPEFSNILRKANISQNTVVKADKEAWTNYVKKHNVPEAVVWSRGKSATNSDRLNLVIIEGAGSADGYYVYSADDAMCLKFESGLE